MTFSKKLTADLDDILATPIARLPDLPERNYLLEEDDHILISEQKRATTDEELCKRVAYVLSADLAERTLSAEQFNRITEIETELIYMLEDIDD